MSVAARISKTSLFVACLNLDSKILTIPKHGLSCWPFDSKYGVNVTFEEDTFADHEAMVEFKVFTSLSF